MKRITQRYKTQLENREFLRSVIGALIFLLVSLVVNFYASVYAGGRASSPVTDMILSNIRIYDVDALFIYGPMIFWTLVSLFLLLNPERLAFTLKSIALFVLIRSVFVMLTHIGPFPGDLLSSKNTNALEWFTSKDDLFFSGHTGLPFLLALLFWENRKLRYFFLCSSIFFAVVVLLGHYHYSIDVFAAFFITYAIADLAKLFFKKDHALFLRAPFHQP